MQEFQIEIAGGGQLPGHAVAVGGLLLPARGGFGQPPIGKVPSDNDQSFAPAIRMKQRDFVDLKFPHLSLRAGLGNFLDEDRRLGGGPGLRIGANTTGMSRLKLRTVHGHFGIRAALPGIIAHLKQILSGRICHQPAPVAIFKKDQVGDRLDHRLELLLGLPVGGFRLNPLPGMGYIRRQSGQQFHFLGVKHILPVRLQGNGSQQPVLKQQWK